MRRAVSLEGGTAAATIGLALLVAYDGSPWWRMARVLAVLALGTGCIVALTRMSGRWRGGLAVLVGMFVLAVGAGFIPHLVKADRILVGVVGVIEVVLGMILLIAGWSVATHGLGWIRRGLSQRAHLEPRGRGAVGRRPLPVDRGRHGGRGVIGGTPRRSRRSRARDGLGGPGAGHTAGLDVAPDEWEARVTAFLEASLGPG